MESDCLEALRGFQQQRDWNPTSVAEADYLLNRVVQALRPPPQEWQARTAVIDRLQAVLAGMPDFQGASGGRHSSNPNDNCLARVLVFGSFCSSLYHKGSDLDLTITGQWRNRHGQPLDMHCMSPVDTADMLHRIRRALMSHRVASADPSCPPTVINARVPLVMYTDAESGVQVDISVCNHGGAFKSRFIRELSQFDTRFEALYRLVKLWAELNNLNDPKTGTLNSWSITQMVIFHLQNCKPAILPPLWLMFYNEPTNGLRPLDQQQHLNRGSSNRARQQQQPANRTGAPYELLQVCERQRQRYQPVYNSSSSSNNISSNSEGQSLTELLVGFFVRFNEVFMQWLDFGRHRNDKMCTWLGRWDVGGCLWRQEYLVMFEDPFDSTDNTARTLGTRSRNDGGCWLLRDQLQLAVNACSSISHQQDIDHMLQKLFRTNTQQVLQHSFDPIPSLQQQQQHQQQQHQQQLLPQPPKLGSDDMLGLANRMQQLTVQRSQHSNQRQQQHLPLLECRQDGLTDPCQQQQGQSSRGFERAGYARSSNDASEGLMHATAMAEAALISLAYRPRAHAAHAMAQLYVD